MIWARIYLKDWNRVYGLYLYANNCLKKHLNMPSMQYATSFLLILFKLIFLVFLLFCIRMHTFDRSNSCSDGVETNTDNINSRLSKFKQDRTCCNALCLVSYNKNVLRFKYIVNWSAVRHIAGTVCRQSAILGTVGMVNSWSGNWLRAKQGWNIGLSHRAVLDQANHVSDSCVMIFIWILIPSWFATRSKK